jgi:hypothetical protein
VEGWKRRGRTQMGLRGLDTEMGWASLLLHLSPGRSFQPTGFQLMMMHSVDLRSVPRAFCIGTVPGAGKYKKLYRHPSGSELLFSMLNTL